jgi:hypothetical protein
MMTVRLGGKKAAGRVALVDDGDYDLVMQYRWFVQEDTRPGQRSGPYARAQLPAPGREHLFMHSLIADFPKPDHIDGDGLNNQRSNLRPATASQNMANRRAWGRSPYKGVSWGGYSWAARIGHEGKILRLGYFKSEEDAARAYDIAAIELYGGFARLNFPDAA